MTYVPNVNPSTYFAGAVADTNPVSIVSHPNTDTANIPFGIAVVADTTNNGWKLPTLATQITTAPNVVGVTTIILRDKFYAYDSNLNISISDPTVVPPVQRLAAVVEGDIAVNGEEAVNAGDQVYIRYASGSGGTQLGAFRKSADTTTAAAHPRWFYATSAAANTIAIVRTNS